MHASKKGMKQRTADLGVGEWRAFQLGGQKRPGRARERRRRWLTAVAATTQEKEKEGRRDGRGMSDQGRCNTQKLGGEGTTIDVIRNGGSARE
jgi:hypothetical protein